MLIRVNISLDVSFECSNLNLCTFSSRTLKNRFDGRAKRLCVLNMGLWRLCVFIEDEIGRL